jgi:hypothetical protein
MFNTVKPLSTVSERTAKSKQLQENDGCRKLFILNYLGELYENYHYRADFSLKL